MAEKFILAFDQGTTSSRALVFGGDFAVRAAAGREFAQHFPRSGWVEHTPDDLVETVVDCGREALATANLTAADIAAAGVTNQRETTVLWEADSGKAVHPAIVWQDRRAAELCDAWRAAGAEEMITGKTGLLIDPYFSAGKIAWLFRQQPELAKLAAAGKVLFGTVDTFLLWHLCGRVHKTDATNACRTMLYNIHTGDWDDDLLKFFGVPRAMLPEICDCAADFGEIDAAVFGGKIAVRGVAGDQQAAAVGQGCFAAGMLKATYGTGCFALLNTGDAPAPSANRLLTTVAYQLDGKRAYALEGAIFVAGACVQWLRDELRIVETAAESGVLAAKAEADSDVVLVPAFTGLGAPYWDAAARGAIFGLTRAAGRAELARAALESVCLQTDDLLAAMKADGAAGLAAGADGADGGEILLRADGGMAASDWTMQRLADITGVAVERPAMLETTARGAAYLAGLRAGVYPAPAEFARGWRAERRFVPQWEAAARAAKRAQWQAAVRAARGFAVAPPQAGGAAGGTN